MKPIIKWPGGKRKSADFICGKITPLLGEKIYIEPFFGGGAIFLQLEPKYAVLGDACVPLWILYNNIIENPAAVADALDALIIENGFQKETYYKVRDAFDCQLDSPLTAAQMIYLNKTCFNGLFRQNKKGKFNVPWGKRVKPPKFPSRAEIFALAELLNNKEFICGDFSEFKKFGIEPRNTVQYYDPPYVDTFSQYTDDGFNDGDQIRLANLLREEYEAGAQIFASNMDCDRVRELYSWVTIEIVPVFHAIGPKGAQRAVKNEVLIQAVHE